MFKIGDIVVCVEGDYVGNVIEGEVYTVCDVSKKPPPQGEGARKNRKS